MERKFCWKSLRGPDILIASGLSLNGCVPKPHLWGVYPILPNRFSLWLSGRFC